MSYEFTGRYSPSQIASGLQTYGSTGAAMSPEQNNPVQMPQNQAKSPADDDSAWTQWTGGSYNTNADSGMNQALAGLAYAQKHPELQQQAIDFSLNTYFGGKAPNIMPWAKQWDDYSNPEKIAFLGQTVPIFGYDARWQQQQNNIIDTGDWNDPIGDAARGSSALWADTAYDPNVYNPTVRADQYAAQKSQSDFYNQNGGWLKQGGMGGNDLGNVDFDTRYEQGGMGGNDLGDVDLTKRQTPQVDYAFTGRTQSPEQNSPTEQKGNWLKNVTRNPVNKDLAIMASNLVMPGLGKIWGANTAPTYSISPNTTFGQKAAHVADNFVRNLPIVGTPYALATDLYRQHQANTDEWSRPAMQSEFEKWAPTVPYGNGMDMADPSYLQNQALAKAMADKGIGQQYSFTRGQ